MRRRRIIKLFAIAAPWSEEEEEEVVVEFVGESASSTIATTPTAWRKLSRTRRTKCKDNDDDGGRDDNRVFPVFKFGGKEMIDASGVTGRLDTSSSVATNTWRSNVILPWCIPKIGFLILLWSLKIGSHSSLHSENWVSFFLASSRSDLSFLLASWRDFSSCRESQTEGQRMKKGALLVVEVSSEDDDDDFAPTPSRASQAIFSSPTHILTYMIACLPIHRLSILLVPIAQQICFLLAPFTVLRLETRGYLEQKMIPSSSSSSSSAFILLIVLFRSAANQIVCPSSNCSSPWAVMSETEAYSLGFRVYQCS